MSDTSKEPTAFRPVRTKDYWLNKVAAVLFVEKDHETDTLLSITTTPHSAFEDFFAISAMSRSERSSLTKLPLHVPRPTSYGFHKKCLKHIFNWMPCTCLPISPSSVYGMPLDEWNKYGEKL